MKIELEATGFSAVLYQDDDNQLNDYNLKITTLSGEWKMINKAVEQKFHFMRDNYKSFPVYVIPYDKEGRYHECDAVGTIRKYKSGKAYFTAAEDVELTVEELDEILDEMKEMTK